jgi:hypothetical protein
MLLELSSVVTGKGPKMTERHGGRKKEEAKARYVL